MPGGTITGTLVFENPSANFVYVTDGHDCLMKYQVVVDVAYPADVGWTDECATPHANLPSTMYLEIPPGTSRIAFRTGATSACVPRRRTPTTPRASPTVRHPTYRPVAPTCISSPRPRTARRLTSTWRPPWRSRSRELPVELEHLAHRRFELLVGHRLARPMIISASAPAGQCRFVSVPLDRVGNHARRRGRRARFAPPARR